VEVTGDSHVKNVVAGAELLPLLSALLEAVLEGHNIFIVILQVVGKNVKSIPLAWVLEYVWKRVLRLAYPIGYSCSSEEDVPEAEWKLS